MAGVSAAPEKFNLDAKFSLFAEQWQPKVVAEMNDYQFKLVKLQGEFIWHDHQDTDETFIVLDGELRIDFRDGAVTVAAGEKFWRSAARTHPHRPPPSSRYSCARTSSTALVPLMSLDPYPKPGSKNPA